MTLLDITPEQKAALDAAHLAEDTMAIARDTLELGARVKRTLQTYVPDMRAKVTSEGPEVAAFVWRDTWRQLLTTIDAALPDDAAKTRALGAIHAVYPVYSLESLAIAHAAMREAVRRLSVATAETVEADLTDIEEAFPLLWG